MKKFLALVLALVMTMSLVTVSASAKTDFTDDAKINNAEAVEVLNAMGVLTGYADGTFRPENTLTRGAGAKIIAYLVLGQKAADKLTATYSIFKDVTDSVGLAAYIEWAYAAGIVDGYGDGNFGPYNTLTEFAFGKMLLTALGYVSSEEGYVGAGWQKNVYADALAAGVYDGTETAGLCTRDTAARMALGALTAEVVVYGKKTNLWVSGDWSDFDNSSDMLNAVQKFLNKIGVITTEGAVATGAYLWQNYAGLYYTADANDVFDRPGHAWTYKTSFDKFYMDAPVKEYTTMVAACDVLVDLGIAKTSKSSIDVDYLSQNGDEGSNFVLNHKNCDNGAFGGVGSLTQVFELADGDYVITTIDTYLAKVEAVKAAKHGLIGDEAKLTVHTKSVGNEASNPECSEKTVYVEDITGLSKGDYLLVNVAEEDEGYPCDVYSIYNGKDCMGAYLAIVGEPTTVEGKLTKLTKEAAMKLTVGGKEYAAAYEYAHSANKLSTDKTSYIWFLDQYGNIIADMLPASAAAQYGRIDALDWINDTWKSEFAQANLVTAADTTVTESVVDLDAWGKEEDGTWKAMTETTGEGKVENASVSDVAKKNSAYYVAKNNYGVVSYVVDADGDYYVQTAGELLNHPTTAENDLSITKGQSKLGTGAEDKKAILVDDDTQYLVYLGTAGYKAYKGFNNVPSMSSITDIVAVATTVQGGAYAYAEFVFVYAPAAIFAGETVEAYVFADAYAGEDEDHYFYNVWVDGKETTIVADKDTALFDKGEGIYHISFNADAEALKSTCCVSMTGSAGVGSVNAWALIKVGEHAGHYYNFHVNQEGGNNAVNDLNFKSAKVYLVGAGEITEFDYKDLVAGTKFVVKFAAGTKGTTNVVDTIYVYELPEGTWGYKPLDGAWA